MAVAHTAFEVCPGGAADALADALGFEDVSGLEAMETSSHIKVVTFAPSRSTENVAEALAAAGAGRIGRYRGCSYRNDGVGTF